MIRSLILRTTTAVLLGLMLLFSVFILFRGHNEPGGGFIGGLIASTAFALHSLAYGARALRQLMFVNPRTLVTAGLGIALASGMLSLAMGEPFMTSQWVFVGGPVKGETLAIGTPLVFDIGVYLVVIGSVLTVVQALQEEDN
jgi:multicomponent Na+:H+ antiporter subunit B